MKTPLYLDVGKVDEWLAIMYKLGFIDPKIKPSSPSTEDEQFRTAQIFESWLDAAAAKLEHSRKIAERNGSKVGKLIMERAAHNGLQFMQVLDCVRRAADFYTERLEEFQMSAADKTRWKDIQERGPEEMKLTALMLAFFSAASTVMDHAYNKAKKGSGVK